jgi:hypothetical protein
MSSLADMWEFVLFMWRFLLGVSLVFGPFLLAYVFIVRRIK